MTCLEVAWDVSYKRVLLGSSQIYQDIGKVMSPSKFRTNGEFHLFLLRTVSYNVAGHPSWGLAWTTGAGWLRPIVPSLVLFCGGGVGGSFLTACQKALPDSAGITVPWR